MDTKSFIVGLSVAGAFMLGCVSASMVVPPARAGTSPQRWEYHCFDEWGADDVTEEANKVGKQGWEMAGGNSLNTAVTWCFKRPLP